MASVNPPQSAAPTMYTVDDDLGKWLDLDGLCQDSLSDVVGRDMSPLDCSVTSESVSATQPQPGEPTQQAEHLERAIKSGSKLKRQALSRNSSLPEYSVICFPSNPSRPGGIKKKRRDFDDKRRLEVAQVRRTGACFRCKMRRISV
ncbi:hypothetical protein G7Z17_g8293 [Cylindrodendrum hubeiense]|uniref:Uncharacterized protein n=1 Tax=Cylindrodendrum hubeiense TaxID=595255 RepID=A0A9P5H3W9_9HYPO|nr:hypothetical protein G7Z17_g8293 [Cylindrodendrum hubeiense]